jgi:hypothetical protein
MSTELNDLAFDPGQRRLCPDGTCVGVIGEDGKCKLCGAVDPAGPPASNAASAAPVPASDPEPASPEPVSLDPNEDGFDPNRRLCADDSCIGVLDQDGRCKVCGRAG